MSAATVAITGAVIGGGLAAAGAAGVFDEDVPPPPKDRGLYDEGNESLSAMERLYPRQRDYAETALTDFTALGGRLTSAQREGELADLERYGARALQAFRTANPELASLLSEMNSQAMGDLQARGGLTPFEQRQVQQDVRGAQASRGMGYGNRDVFEEAVALYGAGANRESQRRQFAGNVISATAAQADVPYRTILGRSAYDTAYGRAPQTDPFNPYSADVYGTNYNAAWGNRFQAQNANSARNSGLMNFGGSIGGSIIGAAGRIAAAGV